MHQSRQLTLDMVRGLAILLVLLFHFEARSGLAAIDTVLVPIGRAGWAGVDLFFVLSGFLVGRMILEQVGRDDFDRRRFFIRRALRLWPALYAYLAVLALAGGIRIWPVLLHVQNYHDDVPSHLWSLAVEEHFYLAVAVLLPWLAARRGRSAIVSAMAAILVLSLILRLGALWAGSPLLSVQIETQYRLDAQAAGVLLAALQLYRPVLFDALARQRLLLSGVALAGLTILVLLDSGSARHGIGFTIAWVSSTALVMLASGSTVSRPWQRPAHALAWLGTIAYSLYLWHASIGRVVAGLIPAAPPFALLLLQFAAAIAVAAVAWRWIEAPAMRLREVDPARLIAGLRWRRTT